MLPPLCRDGGFRVRTGRSGVRGGRMLPERPSEEGMRM